ncbi:hypothetical protein [Streptomyces sp. NPDC048643]|uniref:hypothetical protein n=1 Tax=Streptomyces sp. NPDC048643 TaxID=3155637 RepID=UPI0034488282
MSGDDVKSKLVAIVSEFSEMTGSLPSLKEFLQLLEWSADGIYSTPLAFEVTLVDGSVYSGPEDSKVPELDDSIFSDAADILAGLFDEGNGVGGSPSELAAILLSFINSGMATLVDLSDGGVSRLSIESAGNAVRPEPGDILAVPSVDGWRAVIVVARNRFGVALGIFRDRFDSLDSVNPRHATAYRFPVYSDDAQVLNGSWEIINHEEGLLSAFPAEPEIYHLPNSVWPGQNFGEFGAAEDPSGNIRLIDADEARAVGIVSGSYRQSYTSDFLQQSLRNFTDCKH